MRTDIHRVVVDTPALLNMVKHCRETEVNSQGFLMGVMQRAEGETVDSLLITQTMPMANKAQMNELMKAMENESQKLMDTNEIGFYVSSRMGLAFDADTVSKLLVSYKKFKNSVFIVYDVSKADYGMNPIHAFRLSEKAISCFTTKAGHLIP